jgi:predicted type IV restriction endonuclease
VLKILVSHVLDNHDKKKIKSVVADGAHGINRNFRRLLEDKKIIFGIKIISNSIVSYKTKKLRNQKSRLQTKYLLKWKKKKIWI